MDAVLTQNPHHTSNSLFLIYLLKVNCVQLAWRSGSVMDYNAVARGSIPVGNGVFTELHVLRKGQ